MDVARRPDPDDLLAHVSEEEKPSTRGKLTILFGSAPGVGKTYTMLEAARVEMTDQKRDVIVGVVETHGRYDTASLLIGLELLPRRVVEHRGVRLEELDLDAALARKPSLVLVDELAHTNAPGSRHPKRWQDVLELLDAGIDVFATLNVQHLESLNDVVAQITGVVVRETVPDAVFDKAHEVRVVDLPVDELLDRLHEGKVYVPQQAALAVQSFFKEGNLIALRELSLRRTAERVDAKMRGYKAAHGILESWHTGERVLVCISASPHSTSLARSARRMATSLHAELVGLYVETPAALRLSKSDRARLADNMRLIERLGGEAVTLRAEDAAAETVRYARKRNVTKLVVGKPTHPRWRDMIKRSFVDEVVRHSREIDVYVISRSNAADVATESASDDARGAPSSHHAGYFAAVMAVTFATLVSWFTFGREQLADVVMVYLLGVVVVAMRYGYGPSIVSAVLAVVAFDFIFIPPFFSLAVADLRHVVTFAVMFIVALVISHLTQRVREQADSARGRERRTGSLYDVARELGAAQSIEALLASAAKHLREVFAVSVAVFLPDGPTLSPVLIDKELSASTTDLGVAEWVWRHQRAAGLGTDTLPASSAMFVPLSGSRGRVGILALLPTESSRLDDPDERQLLATFAGLVGSALERTALAGEARQARLAAETERLRNALLSSISHDLRTPLAVVTGATSALLDPGGPTDERARRELLETAHEEAERLARLVRNLLDMTRLEAGALKVRKEPQSIEEIVGAALNRVDDRLRGRDVRTDLAADLPQVSFDPALIEQVLINLLENATKYSPPGSPLDVAARLRDDAVEIEVADRGTGIPHAELERVFDKFYRGRETEGGGVGLGLTICRGIVSAHGGRIWVEERPGGGASFRFTLPCDRTSAPLLDPGLELPPP